MENKGVTNAISVVIALLIVGVVGFVVYKCFIEIGGNPNTNTTGGSVKQLSDGELRRVGLEKYNLLYSKTNYFDNSFIFFQDEEVNINNLKNQDKLFVLYSLLSDEDKNKTGQYEENCFLNKGVYTRMTYPDSCSKESFDKSVLTEKLYNYFDNNMAVVFEDFFSSSSSKCFFSEPVYNCYLSTSEYSIKNYKTLMKFDSAKQNGDELEVYSYLLTIRKNPGNNFDKGIYSNASATKKIDDLTIEVSDTITQEFIDDLVNKYKDKITRYKSVFKIVNSNYLWEKTVIEK